MTQKAEIEYLKTRVKELEIKNELLRRKLDELKKRPSDVDYQFTYR